MATRSGAALALDFAFAPPNNSIVKTQGFFRSVRYFKQLFFGLFLTTLVSASRQVEAAVTVLASDAANGLPVDSARVVFSGNSKSHEGVTDSQGICILDISPADE